MRQAASMSWAGFRRLTRRRTAPAPAPDGDAPRAFLYDAFASYATDPDGALVREVEVFMESLRENSLVAPAYRRTLEVCVDGSDFSLPRRGRNRADGTPEDEVFDLIRAYMEKCRLFVLFVGPRSARHPWIHRELSWWLDNREEESVLIVVTHGRDSKNERETTFPEAVVRRELDRRIWIDLRGFGAGKGADLLAARPYEEERLRLAAALLGPDEARRREAPPPAASRPGDPRRGGAGRRARSWLGGLPVE
jgi:hypothetical protein